MSTTNVAMDIRGRGAVFSRLASGLVVSALLSACGGGSGGEDGNLALGVRISEFTTCQGDQSKPMTGSTIVVTNVVVGSLLAGRAGAGGLIVSADFLSDARN